MIVFIVGEVPLRRIGSVLLKAPESMSEHETLTVDYKVMMTVPALRHAATCAAIRHFQFYRGEKK